jgi:hypothetical protein
MHVGSRTNRASAVFQVELSDILESVPERVSEAVVCESELA